MLALSKMENTTERGCIYTLNVEVSTHTLAEEIALGSLCGACGRILGFFFSGE